MFLDTNVLASALATRGLCADVLREVMAKHELIVSEPLMIELKRTLTNKFNVPSALAEEMLDFFIHDLKEVEDDPLHKISINDKDDVLILSSALNRHAQVFVTGDKELLAIGELYEMEVLSPRMFWERIKKLKDS